MKNSIIWLVIFLISGFFEQLHTCSCIGKSSVYEAIKDSDLLIVGVILNKQFFTIYDSTSFRKRITKYTIVHYEVLVQDLYKGEINNDTLIISTGLGNGDCGVKFNIGDLYILYGKKNIKTEFNDNQSVIVKQDNIYNTNICTRTSIFDQIEINEIEKYEKKKSFKRD